MTKAQLIDSIKRELSIAITQQSVFTLDYQLLSVSRHVDNHYSDKAQAVYIELLTYIVRLRQHRAGDMHIYAVIESQRNLLRNLDDWKNEN